VTAKNARDSLVVNIRQCSIPYLKTSVLALAEAAYPLYSCSESIARVEYERGSGEKIMANEQMWVTVPYRSFAFSSRIWPVYFALQHSGW
jgi:hypothetical protein